MYKNLKLSELKPAEIKHSALPDWFIERVKAFKVKLVQIEPSTIAATLRSFQCDTNPERELAIWERIADTYTVYISENGIGDDKIKQEVFAVVLGISMDREDYSTIKRLTPEQIKVLTYNYRGL